MANSNPQPYNIGLQVGANIDPLKDKMKEGSNAVGQFVTDASKELKKLASRDELNNLAKKFAVVGTAAVAGLSAAYVAGANFVDGQNKIARALGGTIEGFQALEYAADLAGVSAESLETEIRKLNALLANPSEQMAEGLAKLGLNAKQLLGMDVDARVSAFADRFAELGYSTAQADAALKEMGLKSMQLTKMFIDGGDAIRDAKEELKAWGFAISEIDAGTIENANDAWSKAERILKGLTQVIAIQLSPFIEDLIRQFTEAAKKGGGAGNVLLDIFTKLAKPVLFVADSVVGVIRVFKILGEVGASMVTSVAEAVLRLGQIITTGPAAAVNGLIKGMNKIAGTKIEWRMPNFEFGDQIAKQADIASAATMNAFKNIDELLNKPLPSAAIEQWAAGVKAAAQSAGEDVAAARPDFADGNGQGRDGTGVMIDTDALEQSIGQYEYNLAQITADNMDKLINEMMPTGEQIAEVFVGEEQRYKEHWAEMNRIAVEGAGGVAQLVAKNFGDAAGSTVAAGKSMLDSFSGNSRKMFEINKAWGLADAIVSTAQGVAKGVAMGPAGIPQVAWALATGGAQIAKIRSQTFGGGAGSSGGVGTPGRQETPTAQSSPEQESNRSLTIKGFDASHLYSGSQLQNFAGALEEFWNDGGGKGRVIYAGKK